LTNADPRYFPFAVRDLLRASGKTRAAKVGIAIAATATTRSIDVSQF
jgi:hypothetical protein